MCCCFLLLYVSMIVPIDMQHGKLDDSHPLAMVSLDSPPFEPLLYIVAFEG